MSALISVRKNLQRPGIVAALLVLAVCAWGAILLLQTSPEQRHLEAGIAYARQQQGPQAEREWLAATTLNADDPRPWEYLSEYDYDTHNWSGAADALRQVLRLDPNMPHLHARLAACSLQSGDELTAYNEAEAALKRDPNDADTIALFCGLLAHTGEDRRRLNLLHRLIQLRPNDAAAQTMLAEALVGKALYDEARPVVEGLLRQDPQNAEAAALHGMILLNTDPSPQGMAQAETDLQRALTSPRFAAFAHFNLGKLYKRQGQPQKAVVQLEAAAQALPDKHEVFFELADACAQAGQAQKAAQARQRSEALEQEDRQIHDLQSRCAANPNDFDAHLQLAHRMLARKDYRGAEIHLNRAQALRPDAPEIQSLLRQLAASSGTPANPSSAPAGTADAALPLNAGGSP